MNLCVIPARSGSKRIKRKNTREFAGKPMLYWSINSALQANCFDKIIVSTDDKETSDLAIDLGAEVPFIRPSNLADDYASTISVMKHSIEWYKENLIYFDNVCCLYPATPLLQPKYIAEGLRQLLHFDYCFAALEFNHPVQRGFKFSQSGAIEKDRNSAFHERTQDLPNYWHDAGQFYWGKCDAWLAEKQIFSEHSTAVKLERLSVVDIDFPEDWKLAELIFKSRL